MSSQANSAPPRVAGDGRIKLHCEIACQWADGEHGMEVEALDLEPAPKGREHKPHRITVCGGLLVCDCHEYLFSRWHPAQPKECKHLTGDDGLGGAAAFLEVQSKRRDLAFRQRAIVRASQNDPHRVYVRAERERRARATLQPQMPEMPAAPPRPRGPASEFELADFFNN